MTTKRIEKSFVTGGLCGGVVFLLWAMSFGSDPRIFEEVSPKGIILRVLVAFLAGFFVYWVFGSEEA